MAPPASLGAAFERIVQVIADAIVTINPAISRVAPTSGDAASVATYWHTAPADFVREWLITHAALLPAIWALSGRGWAVRLPGHAPPPSSADVWANKLKDDKARSLAASPAVKRGGGGPATLAAAALAVLDRALVATLVIVLGALVYYKGTTGRLAYFAQPCHLQSLALVALSFARAPDGGGAKLFQLFLATWYGAFLALAAPDLRDQTLFLEVPMFFVEHAALVLLPAVWIARRKFDLFGGLRPYAFCYALFWFAHLTLFVPVSLLSGKNINYMMAPPAVALLREGPLAAYPYRAVMGGACAALTLATAAAVRLLSWASGADAEFAAELSLERAAAGFNGVGAPVPTLVVPLAARSRKAAPAAAAAAPGAVPTEAGVLLTAGGSSSGGALLDASLAGTMAERVPADSLYRAAAAAAASRAAAAASGVSLKAVRTGVAATAVGLLSIIAGPTAAAAAAPARGRKPAAAPAAAAPASAAKRAPSASARGAKSPARAASTSAAAARRRKA